MYIAVGYDAGVALIEATVGVGESLKLSPVVKPLVVASRNVTQMVIEAVTETVQAVPVVGTVVVDNVTTVTVVREVSPLGSLGITE